MKTNWMNIAIGVAVVLTVLYYINPSMFMSEGFAEEPQSQKIGGYIGLAIFMLVVIGGFAAIAMKK
jgi:hypothetical protein